MTDERQAWDQLDEESPQAFAAFVLYRSLKPDERSLAATEKLRSGNEKPSGTVTKWSRTYDWVERAKAWDGYLDKAAQKALEYDHVQARRDLITMGRGLLSAAGAAIVRDGVSGAQAARAAEVGAKLVALGLGEPTEIPGEPVQPDRRGEGVTEVNDDEVLDVLARAGVVASVGGSAEPAEPLDSALAEEAVRQADGVPSPR